MPPPTPPIPITQPPPPIEDVYEAGEVNRAFKNALIVGVPLAVVGIVVALISALSLSNIQAYAVLGMGISVVLTAAAFVVGMYSWFRSLRVIEREFNRLERRITGLQQARQAPTYPMPQRPPVQQPQQAIPLNPPFIPMQGPPSRQEVGGQEAERAEQP